MTAACLESLSEEMNYGVQGTEMFWTDPDGTEAILQVRAASLCSDERLIRAPETVDLPLLCCGAASGRSGPHPGPLPREREPEAVDLPLPC